MYDNHEQPYTLTCVMLYMFSYKYLLASFEYLQEEMEEEGDTHDEL